MPKSSVELFEEHVATHGVLAAAQSCVVVGPPEGAKVIVNVGGVCRDWPADRPLPSGALAWAWHDAKAWLWPHQWPHGVATVEEEAAERAARRGGQKALGVLERVKDIKLAPRKHGIRPALPAPDQEGDDGE